MWLKKTPKPKSLSLLKSLCSVASLTAVPVKDRTQNNGILESFGLLAFN